MSANDRTGVGSGSAEWQTPPELFARLHRRFQFDYDAFASHENHLLPTYSTVDGTFERRGPCHCSEPKWCSSYGYMGDADGLAFDWTDRRVWMNPPYSRGLIEKAVAKAAGERHNAAIIVALIPASTDTRWFQQYLLPYAHIDWLPKRVRFIDPATGEPGASPPSGSVIAVFKSELMP